jgi:phage head maturation protease
MIKSAREDEYGLWYTADLYDTQLAKDTHAKLKVSPNAFGSSVGFMPIKRSEIDSGYEYAEVALYEITVTAVPANEFTSAQAKREEMIDNIRKRIAELEAKVAELSTAAVPAESVGGAGEGDNGSSRAKSLPATISNKRRRLMAILEAEMEQEK